MTAAPKGGEGMRNAKRKAPQQQPGGPKKSDNFHKATHSAPEAQNQAAQQHRRYPPSVLLPARLRRKQITSLLIHRHGGPCRTDDATAWFDEMAVHLVLSCRPSGLAFVAEEWARRHAPDLDTGEIAATLERVRRDPPFYTSADIGRRLNVTANEKALLGLTHIAAADVSPKSAAEAKRARNRDRMRSSRAASGETKTPRDQSIRRTVERLPGEALSTFYRRIQRERRASAA